MRIGRKENPIFQMDDFTFMIVAMLLIVAVGGIVSRYLAYKSETSKNVQQQSIQAGVGENPPDKP